MAALFAAGVLLQPAGVQAALVTLDSSYQLTASDPGLITAGKVLIRAGADTEKGVVGLESRGFTMLVDGSFQPLALDVDLQSVPEAVGLLVVRDEGAMDEYAAEANLSLYSPVDIRAATAVASDGRVTFGGRTSLEGALRMKQGELAVSGAELVYSGDGEVGLLQLLPAGEAAFHAGSADGSGGTAFLRVDELSLLGGTVAVHGSEAAGASEWRMGSALLVGTISNTAAPEVAGDAPAAPSLIRVTGNGVLAIGTQLDRPNDKLDEAVRESISGFDDLSEELQARARLAHILADADLFTNNRNAATLVTAAGLTQDAVAETVTIEVGETTASAQTGGVYLGSDARWIIYYGEQSDSRGNPAKTPAGGPLSVHADKNSQLIIYGWDGRAALPDLQLLNFAVENVYSLNGVRTHVVDGRLERQWCWQFAGLQGDEIVRRVEENWQWGEAEARPGYSFIVDSFDPDRMGFESYVREVDSALFLPVSSGAAAAVERVERDIVNSVLSHDYALFEGAGHWWADGRSASYDAGRLFSSGPVSWGFEADAVYGTLGFDLGLAQNWVATVAASFSSIDVDSRGLVTAMTSEASSASLTASAAWLDGATALKLALSYTHAEMNVRKRSNAHLLESEPTADIVTAAVRWETRLGEGCYVRPMLQAAVHYAMLEDGAVGDSTESVYGTGFETDAGDRLWSTLTAGAGAGMQFEALGLLMRPQLEVSAAAAFGDRNWEVTSTLFDGSASSSASFESTSRYLVRAAASIEIASSGFKPRMQGGIFGIGARPAGGQQPWAWSLSLLAGFEAAADHERGRMFGIHFRQLF